MSIGPVLAFGSAGDVQVAETDPRRVQPATDNSAGQQRGGTIQTSPEPQPQQQDTKIKSVSSLPDLTQDEVEVQRDAEISEQIIIKYLDESNGNLILQVPSDQVLNVAHGIYQEFVQQIKVQENADASPTSGEGEPHGH